MGLVGMVKSYYLHRMGRLTSLVAIAAPAVVSKVTGVDYVVVYPVILICGMAIFLAVSVYWAGRMWTGLSWPERFLAGAMLCAASFVLAISLREMLYWISGSASYMVPALFVIIILVELVRSAANETVLSTGQIVVLSAIGFLGAGQRVHAILDRGPRRRFRALSRVLPSSPATGGPCSDADGDLHRTCDPAFVTGECGPDGGISGGGEDRRFLLDGVVLSVARAGPALHRIRDVGLARFRGVVFGLRGAFATEAGGAAAGLDRRARGGGARWSLYRLRHCLFCDGRGSRDARAESGGGFSSCRRGLRRRPGCPLPSLPGPSCPCSHDGPGGLRAPFFFAPR